MGFTRVEILDVVKRSPATVAVHDRAGWLGLFGEGAYIEDPIGSPRADKASGLLGKFWDTFIQPHQIEFEVLRDVVLGLDVMRDVIIHTRINERVQIDVPAYLLYQLEDRGGRLEVRRMAAHWELAKLSLGALKLGPRAWWPMTRLFANMIGRMGLGWVGGYLASLWRGVGKSALATVERELATRNLILDSPVVAGSTVSFRFHGAEGGLGLAEFAGEKLVELRLFQEMNGKSALRSAG